MQNLVVLFLFLPFLSLAQKECMTYASTQDIKSAEQYKNNTVVDSYVTKDGITINVGDTLTIGNAVIDRKRYLFNDIFSYVVVGHTKVSSNKEYKHLPHNYSGNRVFVESLFVTHKSYDGYKLWPNRRQTPLFVSIFVRNLKNSGNIFAYSRKTILDIEEAFSSGEIVNYKRLLSREDAIKKLKESKDLMELDFLSKEEYEKIREQLTPIILDNQGFN